MLVCLYTYPSVTFFLSNFQIINSVSLLLPNSQKPHYTLFGSVIQFQTYFCSSWKHMREGKEERSSSSSTTVRSNNGEPRFVTISLRRISTVLGFPIRDSTPSNNHFQFEWHLLLLLPLGQAQITPQIFFRRPRS